MAGEPLINLGSRPLAFWPLEPSKEGLTWPRIETKTEASKTPSSKTDLVEVTNFDKTAEVTGVGKKGPSGETSEAKSRSHLRRWLRL